MVSSSIVFDPVIDDRELKQQSQKVTDEFQDPELSPQMGGGALRSGGQGMGGGGQMGALAESTESMDQTLADRLPVPVPGVSASSVLPVALAGGAGLGMLSAMKSSSAILDSTLGMFGTAIRMFFRPFGDFLGNHLRDMAIDLIDFADKFGDIADSKGLAVAVTSLPGMFGSALGDAVADAITGNADAGDAVTLGLTGLTAAALAGKLPSIGIGTVLGGMSKATLGTKLGSLGMGALVNPLTGSLVALLGGVISLGDLVDGDISAWNLPGKFGEALGQGFAEAWPDMADTIESIFTNNPIFDFGANFLDEDNSILETQGEAALKRDTGGDTTRSGTDRDLPPGAGPGGTPGRDPNTAGQIQGGTRTGTNRDRPANAGPGGGTAVENKLDDVQQEIKNLDGAIRSINLMIDGSEFGELVSETQQDSVHDTNPLS